MEPSKLAGIDKRITSAATLLYQACKKRDEAVRQMEEAQKKLQDATKDRIECLLEMAVAHSHTLDKEVTTKD